MKILYQCVPCVLRQAIDILEKKVKDKKKRDRILSAILKRISRRDVFSMTPPELTTKIHKILKKKTGIVDLYKEEKKKTNLLALKIYPRAKKMVRDSADPLGTAIKLAIAGNIIDYGPNQSFDIAETIERVLSLELDKNNYQDFRKRLFSAKRILYIADNAGEIVFDKLLLEILPKEIEKIVAVKSAPILNDVTIKDADFISLSKIAKVIESGSETPGTSLEDTNKEFKTYFKTSDFIISKGQGNLETLPASPKIFFLLLIKCYHLAVKKNFEMGQIVLWRKK
jgi:uncharacterized protein with ATP-grasp and redox domains